RLLREIRDRGIRITRINLTMRADWLPPGEKRLREALALAVPMGACIVLTSMGFESFDDDILRNLNKGATVEDNLKAVRVMRRLKEEFPEQWGYLREEGGVHGFIHPTPWDDPAVEANLGKIISRHGLEADILPSHSTPLIIHHGSALGDWIRAIEEKENVRFTRYGSIIGWWEVGGEWML
ncbi:MAG: hypothetical protein GY859_39600, partial [Desulfobacterales bacterium]|nr:hypothetical protein [Desulfobacterales bacterium]